MKYTLKNARVYSNNKFIDANVCIDDGVIVSVDKRVLNDSEIIDFNCCYILPGLTDVHTHLREPGFSYKETIKTGTLAAAHGGYTTVCTMPNLNPVPDCFESLMKQYEIIKKDACIEVLPFGAVTKNEMGQELSDIDSMAKYAVGFSDDGKGIQSEEMMYQAMTKIKQYNRILSAHCEDNSLLNGGYINACEYAIKNGHKGICSESEYRQIERDLKLAEKTGCKYHICHISTKESVELIRNAKKNGINVTCETAPHYLTLTDNDLQNEGRFKMNPPLRGETDRQALIDGIKDGTIDMIATDHAPHSSEEKSKGLKGSLMGISGIETAFSILYTELVKKKVISLEKLVDLMHDAPFKRFGIGNNIEVGQPANLAVFNLDTEFEIKSNNFISMGKSTPFDGKKVFGKCLLTMYNGNKIWEEKK